MHIQFTVMSHPFLMLQVPFFQAKQSSRYPANASTSSWTLSAARVAQGKRDASSLSQAIRHGFLHMHIAQSITHLLFPSFHPPPPSNHTALIHLHKPLPFLLIFETYTCPTNSPKTQTSKKHFKRSDPHSKTLVYKNPIIPLKTKTSALAVFSLTKKKCLPTTTLIPAAEEEEGAR